MNLPDPGCVLIADSRRDRFPPAAYQWAALRGIQWWRVDLATADFGAAGLDPKALFALSYRTLTYLDFLPALRRYPAPELTRDHLLANAALDLPTTHPSEVGLRRCVGIYQPWEPPSSYFDEVLSFAAKSACGPCLSRKLLTRRSPLLARPVNR